MRPTRLIPPDGDALEDLDAPAYTRALTPLPEFQRRLAIQAADREEANNRSFNEHFWAAMAREGDSEPRGFRTSPVGHWVSWLRGRTNPGG
jgi:hypothetical protein